MGRFWELPAASSYQKYLMLRSALWRTRFALSADQYCESLNTLYNAASLANVADMASNHCAGWLQDGELGALSDFEALFLGAKFHKGLEMVFTNTQAGALALKIGDREV